LILPIKEGFQCLEELVNVNDAVEVNWFPFCDWIWFRTLNKTKAAITYRPLSSWLLCAIHLVQTWIGVKLIVFFQKRATAWLPTWIRFISSTLCLMLVDHVIPVADSHHPRQWLEIITGMGCVEVAIPVTKGLEEVKRAWEAVQQRISQWEKRGKHPMDLNVNMRFTGPTDAILSGCYGNERTCWIECLSTVRSDDWKLFSKEILSDWLAIAPQAFIHWAKEIDEMPGSFPAIQAKLNISNRLKRFQQARKEALVDPNGIFINPLLQQIGLGNGA
jgi:hypothetical protein